MRFILYFSIICQKLHSSAKNISANVSIKPYRCISRKRDIFSTVLLSRKCSISSVWRSSDSLEFIRRNRLSITSWRKIRYSPIPLPRLVRYIVPYFSNVTSPVSLSLCTIFDADDSLTFIFRASTPRRTEPDCGQLRQIISR